MNLISESIIKRLGVCSVACALPINTVNDTQFESKGLVSIHIRSIHDEFSKSLACLVVPTITNLIPTEPFPRNSIKIPANIRLADPDFHLPRPVDLLIGAGATMSLFSIGQINLSREDHDLILQKTRLGWILAGSTIQEYSSKTTTCYLTSLEKQITKFWTIEEVAVESPRSEADVACEAHFVKNVTRDDNGRYIVRLPFTNANKNLGESRNSAYSRLRSLERKFTNNPTLKDEYTRVVEEYIKLGHMSVIKKSTNEGYYMPHHAVMKESSNTTKLRVVFDASAKTSNGVSLNDTLLTGPTIQDDLFTHLIRFRSHRYAIIGDIEKMYRQVLVHEEDRHYQQILWRIHDEIKTLQLNTLTFGVSSAPFLAIRVIQKLAEDEGHTYPRAALILKKHLYVDNLSTGAETINEARAIRDEIIALLAKGGFLMRQWATNDERILNDLPTSMLHTDFTVNLDRSLRNLGITWNTRDDRIYYSIHPITVNERTTKRGVLSEIAKIFDPLGLIGPVVMYAKKLMQDLWRAKLQWDESLPQDLYTEWSKFAQQIGLLNQFSYDRTLVIEDYTDIQIHGFCDASNNGYGASLYVRSIGVNGKVICRLLCAKSRVAPLKSTTIPRLELCGALLLARLLREVNNALNIATNKIMLWCDSTIVLHWLKTPPHLLKTFVAHRIAETQTLTKSIEWRHIKSEFNPADAISRGQLPQILLQNKTWCTGPQWLSRSENEWPRAIMQTIETPELKRNTCLMITPRDPDIFKRYSSYSKLRRIIAYCFRFHPLNKYKGNLTVEEIETAEVKILRIIQSSQFSEEIKGLKSKGVTNRNRIANLNPFLDNDGLIR
ncbi:PREDICTED: uncharacterized protein LOC105569364, partial [Vollenhovia emeryi]|uniref:uncharacterized protein LOC105569364 n=1 Tax=Vollenhovia emeryi TaxID=411798 RepID=UPI0005F52B33